MGDPDLHFLGHSTVRVEMAGHILLTDPLLTGRVGPLRRVVPAPAPETYVGVDLVLISHLHGDHLHLPSLRLLGPDVRVVVPRGAGAWLRARGFRHVVEVLPGETITHGALRVTAVPAEHAGHRWGPRLTHGPDTPAVGHLVEGGGHRLYVAGDDAGVGERRGRPLAARERDDLLAHPAAQRPGGHPDAGGDAGEGQAGHAARPRGSGRRSGGTAPAAPPPAGNAARCLGHRRTP